MKKIIYASILTVVLVLALSGCSKSREVTIETDETSWDYTEPRTSYEAKYQSEYWNLLGNNAYSKMYYESALESSDDIKKKIYLFYGDKDDSYTVDALKGIQFARLDHPEQKLRACSKDSEEYSELLDEVNSEIQELVQNVNNVDDIIEKHKLIFRWLKENIEYLYDDDVKSVKFKEEEEYLHLKLQTNTIFAQTIYGAIVNKEATSEGMADAYKYICNCCNLESVIVDGYIRNMQVTEFYATYHSWNLVKVYDEWYMIDLNWKPRHYYRTRSCFMATDLYMGEHIPLDNGYDLPWYSKKEIDNISFKDSSEKNEILSNEGIKFVQEDEHYDIYPIIDSRAVDTNIDIQFSSIVYERSLDDEKFNRDISLMTNAKITEVRYYDYEDCLITILYSDSNSVSLPYKVDDVNIAYAQVMIQYNNHEYRVNINRIYA